MFCPNCGKAEQLPETYCRQCGEFLPDLNKSKKWQRPPEEHIKVNTVLSSMSAIVSITLAILLYSFFLGVEGTPVIIYIVAGFLTAMFFWQAQTVWRNVQLKKHFKKRNLLNEDSTDSAKTQKEFESIATQKLLKQPDLSNAVPTSITENTTRKLKNKVWIP